MLQAGVVRTRAPYALARAVAATILVLVGASGAHTWAGGTIPTWPGLVLVGAAVFAGSLLAFAREVPTWALLGVVALAQCGVHESFGLVAAHTHHGAGSHPAAPLEPGWSLPMVLAHLFVAALTAGIWWLGRRARSLSVWWRLVVPPAPLPDLARPITAVWQRSDVLLLVSPRRGPPAALGSA